MKKVWAVILAAALLGAVLFVPIPSGVMNNGGTVCYSALAYKLVHWREQLGNNTYDTTKLYWFPDSFKSVEQLWVKEEQSMIHRLVATVIQLDGSTALVEPVAGEDELRSADRFAIGITDFEDIGAQVGSTVEISYTGGIMESYPAQVKAFQWEIAKNLRHMAYTGQWLDKQTSEKYDNNVFDHIVITEIYSNCFFAENVIPSPMGIKLNGSLSEDWCVGDQITCTYENTYYDAQANRIEADMLSIAASDWQPDPNMCYKPVIYLYPEEETEVSVKLQLDGRLTCTYPSYHGGWQVTAAPDGTLTDAGGQTYNYLYWEGESTAQWDMETGFCVKGEDTAAFLEEALDTLGLSRKEANEFIVYWLPLMQENPYNLISFQADAYTDAARLEVCPAPDTLIRVFMVWKASDSYVETEAQALTAPARTGFTVVEWGGTEVH